MCETVRIIRTVCWKGSYLDIWSNLTKEALEREVGDKELGELLVSGFHKGRQFQDGTDGASSHHWQWQSEKKSHQHVSWYRGLRRQHPPAIAARRRRQ